MILFAAVRSNGQLPAANRADKDARKQITGSCRPRNHSSWPSVVKYLLGLLEPTMDPHPLLLGHDPQEHSSYRVPFFRWTRTGKALVTSWYSYIARSGPHDLTNVTVVVEHFSDWRSGTTPLSFPFADKAKVLVRHSALTCPGFCTTVRERVYITASGCDVDCLPSFGTKIRAGQQFIA